MPAVLTVVALCFAVGIGFWIKQYLSKDAKEPKKIVQQITIVAPPPPPPPPPEPEEEPEPEIEEEVVEEPVDEAMPEDTMEEVAGQDLGIDGDGSAGSDGFGLVARKGGRGLLGGGSGYAADIQATITDVISGDDRLRYEEYSAVVKLWIDPMGVLERFELDQKSGDPETERRLKQLLANLGRFTDGPPLEMPQPIKLRIRSQL